MESRGPGGPGQPTQTQGHHAGTQPHATAPGHGPPAYGAPNQQTNTKALLAMVFGILGLVGLGLIGGVVAVILANMAQKELAERPHEGGHGMAKAGNIMGWIAIVVSVLIILFVILMAMAAFSL